MPATAASSLPGRFRPAGVLALTLLVFGAVVALVTWQQRRGLREQILGREADRLAALAAMQLDIRAEETGEEAANVPGALLVAVLKATQYRGVLGVRVFDADGAHNASDGIITAPEPANASDWARIAAGRSIVRLHSHGPEEELLFVEPPSEQSRLVEAWVPLRRSRGGAVLGAAQFWLDGTEERGELAKHDRRLWMTAAVAWFGGSLVIGGALSWAFRRLDAANRQLRARTEDLQRANRELVLAAKTSAVGAVTAHLMHELKNPIAGLEVLVAGQAEGAGRMEPGSELATASELTRRLRRMVNDVVGVLRDEQSGADFELTPAEIVQVVQEKVRGEAEKRGVMLKGDGSDDIAVAGRRANLTILVLRNLVQNALEATSGGGTVRLRGAHANGAVEFTVEDSGPGLSAEVRARLFQPCASTKSGGSGIGLALSYQLAQQAGGRLELMRSDERGTCFRLVLAPDS